ncbi:ABC transporter permease [Leucothrix arctica]|uniref:ABC transporter permease n=1 Tax=Leucothrix arctica TaxID=1481894 RepID=A0A317CDT9_9GAMM|nr:ABC transporter permease [Leucothrix arctica]PWQ96698.1 ABC transporter permease [Leucothrix arctica]
MLNIGFSEFQRLFRTPLAWVLLAVVQLILAYLFLIQTENYITTIQPQIIASNAPYGVTDLVLTQLFVFAGIMMLAIMPLLTMRSFAEERQNQTLVLLRATPLSAMQIVLGKFLALELLVLCLVGMISLMPLSLLLGTSLDIGQLISAILGLFLLLSSFAAAGLFLSSLTKNTMMAALLGFAFLLVLALLYFAGIRTEDPSPLLVYLSHFGHYQGFLNGIIDSRDIVYYLLFIVVFLALTVRKLDNERLG